MKKRNTLVKKIAAALISPCQGRHGKYLKKLLP